jgi:glutamate 5-kinase
MIIASGERADIINKIMQGEELGTIFLAHKRPDFHLISYLENKTYMED